MPLFSNLFGGDQALESRVNQANSQVPLFENLGRLFENPENIGPVLGQALFGVPAKPPKFEGVLLDRDHVKPLPGFSPQIGQNRILPKSNLPIRNQTVSRDPSKPTAHRQGIDEKIQFQDLERQFQIQFREIFEMLQPLFDGWVSARTLPHDVVNPGGVANAQRLGIDYFDVFAPTEKPRAAISRK